jgi:hypothetical protein
LMCMAAMQRYMMGAQSPQFSLPGFEMLMGRASCDGDRKNDGAAAAGGAVNGASGSGTNVTTGGAPCTTDASLVQVSQKPGFASGDTSGVGSTANVASKGALAGNLSELRNEVQNALKGSAAKRTPPTPAVDAPEQPVPEPKAEDVKKEEGHEHAEDAEDEEHQR